MIGWATFWANFSQAHPVTLAVTNNVVFGAQSGLPDGLFSNQK
jgi:hypothetical protein